MKKTEDSIEFTNEKQQHFMRNIGIRISYERRKQNLTQEKLAEIAELSPQIISTAERGAKEIKIVNLNKISKALNVSLDYLVNGNDINYLPLNDSFDMSKLSDEQQNFINNLNRLVLSYLIGDKTSY